MRRSFLRLVVTSVLVYWAVSILVFGAYAASQTWHGARAQGDGVYLVFDELDAMPPSERAAHLETLQPHFDVPFEVIERADAERRAGREMAPGDEVPLDLSWRQEWLLLAFGDGDQVLAVGPVNPVIPRHAIPVGVFAAIFGMPVLAMLYAWRIERQVSKVETATQALATGDFGTRVNNPEGPSAELASSFNTMAERIEQLVRDRNELVQAVSHELGSPLSRLRFQLALLDDDADERASLQQAMSRELDALEELVSELLAFVQSDASRLERVDFDPEDRLADLLELARLEGPENEVEVELRVELRVDEPVRVHADRRHFDRAIENLLRNAVQHARRRVLCHVRPTAHGVEVAVHDDGPGIPEGEREHVLAPFVRLDADRSRRTGGVGLGLAIVSRILEHHGGSVVIDRAPGLGGSRVATCWPRPTDDDPRHGDET